ATDYVGKAPGILVQSVGGGGGQGGVNVAGAVSRQGAPIALGIGGTGGAGGNAGTVNATLTSDIGTRGDDSLGLTVQSLGGSGGNGAFNVTGGIGRKICGA
ncbi:hypothetical protein GY969_22800, partial [Escherichia coli]|nr:hypothetical protein [Escherichia coli]